MTAFRQRRDYRTRLTLLGVAAMAVALLSSSCSPDGSDDDGVGHRAWVDAPALTRQATCPDYRANAGHVYYWDLYAYRSPLEAELALCSEVVTGSLGSWIVEERSDEDGSYSIAAYIDAVENSVTHDWGAIVPKLWLYCRHSVDDGPTSDSQSGGSQDSAGGLFGVSLFHFGPPQFQYGEPTPVSYRFGDSGGMERQLWFGHAGQAEVALAQPADARKFARDMRAAAATVEEDDTSPMLTTETWDGESLASRGASQGTIRFNLQGLERAAFPVFDACGS